MCIVHVCMYVCIYVCMYLCVHISFICDDSVQNSNFVIFQEKRLKVLKCYNFLWVQRRLNCSPATSFANCVMTLYPLKVHLQTFLSIPVTQKCQTLSCDTRRKWAICLYIRVCMCIHVCLYLYMYVTMHTWVYMYMRVRMCVYVYVCMCVCKYVYIYLRMLYIYIYICVCMYVFIYVWVYIYVCVCVCVCICTSFEVRKF